jgi:hypothetical protein
MDRNLLIYEIYFVYNKIKESRSSRNLELWPIQDYKDFLELIQNNNWDCFGQKELERTDWIMDRYFGRGEFLDGYVPEIISPDEFRKVNERRLKCSKPWIHKASATRVS